MTHSVSQQTNQMPMWSATHLEGTGFTPFCTCWCRVIPWGPRVSNHVDLQIQCFLNSIMGGWCFLGRIKKHKREPSSPGSPDMPSGNNWGHIIVTKQKEGRWMHFRGLGETLPRPISLSWSPYGEPFLLRNAWKILSLAWPMVSQSRTLTEIFRQTSALSFSGIFSKTTFNACKNTNKQCLKSIR